MAANCKNLDSTNLYKVNGVEVVLTDDTRIPTQDENDALVGTNGAPSTANKYVTDSDPRLVGIGDVVGPAAATDSNFSLFDGVTGKLIKDGPAVGTLASLNTVGTSQIDNDSVTLAKMQNAVASSKILGSGDAGVGVDYSEITLGTGLSMSGNTLNGSQITPIEMVMVSSKSDLPAPSLGVITLVDNYTYFFASEIDLLGDRIQGGQNTVLRGTSPEVSILKSTGLGATELISSVYTITLQDITMTADLVFDIDGLGNSAALDWRYINFVDCLDIGTVKNVNNLIISSMAILNSKGLKIDGSIDSFGIDNSIFVGDGLAGNIIDILATATITRRFRIIYSAFVAFGSTVGINVDASATIGNSNYILDTINFSGGGTYLSGVDETSNKASFKACEGITNTSVNGQLYMQSNATVTAIAVPGTFYKVLGTTTPSVDNSKYTHSDNRLTNDSSEENKYLIQCTVSFNSGNNKLCEFGFYDSKLGAVRTPSKTKSTSSGTGTSENVTFHCLVQHTLGDYVEIHTTNNTDTTSITVTEMNFIITEVL
jgi:hypothetical protein